MSNFLGYNVFTDLFETQSGFNVDYNVQVGNAALSTFGSPFSLITRRTKSDNGGDLQVDTTGVKLLGTSASNDNYVVIPTLVSISYLPASTTGTDGSKGFQLFFGSSTSNIDEFLMKDIKFGNNKGDVGGTRWSTSDEMTIWASPHTISISETPAQGSIGTWPRVPIDWVNQDKNNLHADAGKLFPHKILSSLSQNSQNKFGTNRQRELFIRSISGTITVPQIDVYGLVLPLG